MMPNNITFAIITAARDEEQHLDGTITSVASQTILPSEWVIVDDGSTDRTGEIADNAANRFPWIRALHRPNRGFRKPGGGVIEAFYDGYNHLRRADWDFIVKLDADLTFAPDYFEKCFLHFREQPRLGIGGGGIYHEIDGQLKLESNPRFHVRGATKIYRRECWDELGGLLPGPGWDTIDEVRANMLNWSTSSFNELRLVHHRLTGAAEGMVRDRIKHGLACYISGYHPLFLFASCLYRLGKKPYLVGSAAMFWGFLKGYITRARRVNDPRLITYIRAQQMKRLCGLQTIWK